MPDGYSYTGSTHSHPSVWMLQAAHLREHHGWTLKRLRAAGFSIAVRGWERDQFELLCEAMREADDE